VAKRKSLSDETMPLDRPEELSTDLVFSSVVALAAAVRARHVSATEVLEAFLAQIERHNKRLNAVVTLDADGARAAAKAADDALARGDSTGPLHGIPFTLKDAFATKGVRTTTGFRSFDHVPTVDGTVAARLKGAGAILVGKSNVPVLLADYQTSNPIFGQTNNPWDVSRTPGGSSGGAAAALASGMTPFEIGTDLSCSIRIPAHFCGVFGLKPTEHRVSLNGVAPVPQGGPRPVRIMSCVGPLARTADDLALLLSVIAGPDAGDSDVDPVPLGDFGPVPAKGLRIAFAPTIGTLPVANAIRGALESVAARLEAAGAIVEKAALPSLDFIADLEQIGSLIPKITSAFSPGPDNPKASLADYLTALDRRDHSIAAWEAFFEHWDALLCPPAMTTAFPHTKPGTPLEVDGQPQQYFSLAAHGTLFNYSGHPGIVVPSGAMDNGLPIGVQLVGRWWSEGRLVGIAKTLTEMTGGFRRPPGV
jgi:amidase